VADIDHPLRVILRIEGSADDGHGCGQCLREAKISLDDLDVALALMVKLPDLFNRLKQEQQANLLQIIIKRIIVDSDGEITNMS
jgi:hypothetical protein